MAKEKAGTGLKDLPEFFRETRVELSKVTSPTRQETIQATIVTLFIVCFVSLALFVLDLFFNWLMGQVLV